MVALERKYSYRLGIHIGWVPRAINAPAVSTVAAAWTVEVNGDCVGVCNTIAIETPQFSVHLSITDMQTLTVQTGRCSAAEAKSPCRRAGPFGREVIDAKRPGRRLPALGRPAKESTTVPGSRPDSPTSPGTAAVTTFAAAVTPAAQVLGLWAVWGQPPVQRLGAAALSVSPAANRMRWDGSTGRLFRGGTAGAEIIHCTDVGIYYRETFQVQWQRHRWRRY